jgi:small subunit ribosomal protein S3
LRQRFNRAGYSHIDIQRTPLGTRIIVHANRPGLVIGKSGSRIKEITDEVQRRFKLENPMLDVREISNPFLDAQVVADRIAKSLERGSFYKKVAGWYLDEIIKVGAIGVEIIVSGKLGGERGRFQKFKKGYIKHAGYYADNVMDKGHAIANMKPGIVGIQVKILKDVPADVSTRLEEGGEEIEDKRSEEVEA